MHLGSKHLLHPFSAAVSRGKDGVTEHVASLLQVHVQRQTTVYTLNGRVLTPKSARCHFLDCEGELESSERSKKRKRMRREGKHANCTWKATRSNCVLIYVSQTSKITKNKTKKNLRSWSPTNVLGHLLDNCLKHGSEIYPCTRSGCLIIFLPAVVAQSSAPEI